MKPGFLSDLTEEVGGVGGGLMGIVHLLLTLTSPRRRAQGTRNVDGSLSQPIPTFRPRLYYFEPRRHLFHARKT